MEENTCMSPAVEKKKCKIISFATRKGGVGKTTLATTIAEFLASRGLDGQTWDSYRVLVVDIDPQASASTCMIGDARWKECDDAGQTVYQMFYDALHGTTVFDIDKAIVKNASNLGTKNLHLLPSSIKLEDIKSELNQIGKNSKYHCVTAAGVLNKHLAQIKDRYDVIIIDCPPDMGIPTQNALAVSDGYIIPTYPEYQSVYGIPTVIKYIREMGVELGKEIKPYGIIVNRFRSAVGMHKAQLSLLKNDPKNPPVFDVLIDERAKLGESAEYDSGVTTIKGKYGGLNTTYPVLMALTREFIDKVSV